MMYGQFTEECLFFSFAKFRFRLCIKSLTVLPPYKGDVLDGKRLKGDSDGWHA